MSSKFVFLRIQRMNAVNLNLFQFDYDLTWMGFCMSADGRIYCRYGGRDPQSTESRLSKEGLLYAMNEALRLHKEAADRKLPAPALPKLKTPENLGMFKNVKPTVCIHCHLVNEGINFDARSSPLKKEQRQESFYAYPLPENIGIQPDLVRGHIIKDVSAGSPADKAGLKKGDLLRRVSGQPVVTAFDVQFGLNQVGPDNKLAISVERNGTTRDMVIDLPPRWRVWDTSWRKSLHHAQPNLGFGGVDLTAKERAQLKLPATGLAYRVNFISPYGVMRRLGVLKRDDVIVAIDSKKTLPYVNVLGYFALEHKPGDKVELTVLRDGKEEKLTFVWK
jgi:hypothetical protein